MGWVKCSVNWISGEICVVNNNYGSCFCFGSVVNVINSRI